MAVEILAPAGGPEQLVAAVRSGADAVYLGLKGALNARRGAVNFDGAELEQAVRYCHGRGVRVHVTVNTLLTDRELSALPDTLHLLADTGVDAVIVQDLAVAALARRHCPALPLHASTQLAIHNAAGARMAAELGFSRVVLARELTLEEIRALCAASPIECEVFVHGALCMSVSGRCYLSAMLGGRSGNRGVCAQPCRLDYRSGARHYALSLRDMCHIPQLRALEQAGVASLKIEGRLKRPEYVAAAVRACREAREGKEPELESLKAVFSRSGFTDGYLTGRRTVAIFGRRTAEDAAASAAVLGQIAESYRHERAAVPVDITLKLAAGQPAELRATDGEREIQVCGPVPEAAQTRATDAESAERSLARTGGTPFFLQKLDFRADAGLFLPASALGAMRRQALDTLLERRAAGKPWPFLAGEEEETGAHTPAPEAALYLRLETGEQLFAGAEEAERLILPLGEIDETLLRRFGSRLTAELPVLCWPTDEQALEDRLLQLRRAGLEWVFLEDLGALHTARRLGFRILGGPRLNILNSLSLMRHAALGLEEATLSFELGAADIARLRGGAVARGALVYGHLPLMVFRNCPARDKGGCGACDGRPSLRDRRGERVPLLCAARRYTTLLNPIPLYVADRSPRRLDFHMLYFTTERAARCREIFELARAGAAFPGERTRGLYYRELK